MLAGGCFWGVQGVYQHLKGVTNAVSGYAGGEKRTAEYRYVTNGRTGHAESVADYVRPARDHATDACSRCSSPSRTIPRS